MFNLKSFVTTQEGKIFLFGILMLFVYLMSIVSIYLFSVDDANNLVVMSVTNFFFGRAAGISYGFTVEFGDGVIIFMNMMIEFIMVMIIYPLFVLSWNKSLNIEFLKDFFTKVETLKLKYKDYFEKYGKYGLFIFVWFPFWMTGPIVGAIVGFLIGIRHYTTMFIVLGGTSLAIVIWTYFLKEIIVVINQINANASYILLGLIVVVALILKLIKSRK